MTPMNPIMNLIMNPQIWINELLPILERHALLGRLFLASFEFAALALAVGLLITVFRIRQPRLRALLWLIVLAKPLVSLIIGAPLPLLRLAAPRPAPQAARIIIPATTDVPIPTAQSTEPQIPASTSAPELKPSFDWRRHWPMLLTILWVTGASLFAMRLLLSHFRLRRIIRQAAPIPPQIAEQLTGISAKLSIRHPPPCFITHELESPALAGFWRPVILLPAWLCDEADPRRVAWSLRHELMHWRMRDPLAALVCELARILFFFHPAAWWAGAKWKEATELACDRALIQSLDEAETYATELYRMLIKVRNQRRMPLTGGLFAGRTQIAKRIESLARDPLRSPARLSAAAIILVFAFTLITILSGLGIESKAAESAKTPESAPASSSNYSNANSTKNSAVEYPFAAQLPDGRGIAFLGIGKVFGDAASWWSPNGNPLAGSPVKEFSDTELANIYDTLLKKERAEATPPAMKRKTLTFAFRLLGDDVDQLQLTSIKYRNPAKPDDPPRTPPSYEYLKSHTTRKSETLIFFGTIPDGFGNLAEFNFWLMSPDTLRATWNGKKPEVFKYEEGNVAFKSIQEDQGNLFLTATYPFPFEHMSRFFIAYDKAGQRITGIGGSLKNGSSAGQKTLTETVRFDRLLRDDLAKIEYRTKPIADVLLKNIALASNVQTDFGIEYKAPPGEMAIYGKNHQLTKAEIIGPIPSWRTAFDAVYRLNNGEYLKRIPEPFIPERLQYYSATQPEQAKAIPAGPDQMSFEWDASLINRSTAFGPANDLGWILDNVLHLPTFEYSIPDDLLRLTLNGDWIIRAGAEMPNILKDLGKILSEQTGKPVRFEKRLVEHEVIVARGHYDYHPINVEGMPNNPRLTMVIAYLEKPDMQPGGGGGAGDISEFLQAIGNVIKTPVLAEIAPTTAYAINWRLSRDLRASMKLHNTRIKTDDDTINKLLKNISDQTSLTFSREKRKQDVWFIEPN